jgi:hypothetical protein
MFSALSLAVALALGVGAADSNTIIVRIDGKETRVTLAGVNAGSERAAAFAQCLVAGRVLRVSGPHSAAKATLLDDTAVSAHIAEFLQTQTTSDPCALGKAAYQPKTTYAAAAAAPLPAVTRKKKAVREVHVSFSSGGESSKNGLNMPPAAANPLGASYRPPAPPSAPVPNNQPTYANPQPVQSYTPPAAGTYTPPATSTAPVTQVGTQQSLQQQGTQPMEQQPTETIPTTTYSPRPPQ